ncbi:unnamed protein product [Nippostrongylus brasiliensis]|uniref:GPN-loop GTPase 2 n=1 Tax=Nippostrongylus brasiliensis TaxID=27835 RepID=A0A0N4YVX8_NIPBR|nr:unnamed protein product [Nippostrongylus brasiliensis]
MVATKGRLKAIFMNHLTQVVIEVKNLDSVFELDFLRSLCSMHEQIADELAAFDSFTPYLNHLTQVVIEVENLDSVFELDFLRSLCSMHEQIADELAAFDSFTPYRNIWSAANFVSCLSPNFLFNCTELTADDVDIVHNLVDYCAAYREELLTCRLICKTDTKCSQCLSEFFRFHYQ